jgi:acetate---CoA ligase (ADP-forming)
MTLPHTGLATPSSHGPGDVHFADVSALVRPKSVAVVGASDRPGSLGNLAYRNIRRRSQVPGPVVPVNPRATSVDGDICYPSVSATGIPDIDVAFVVVPASQLLSVIEDCGRAGVRNAILFTSGLAETGETGRLLQDRIRLEASRWRLRLYGPNCPGLTNVRDNIYLSPSPGAADVSTPGTVGLVTQGGGIGRALMQWTDHGLGVALWASPGNAVDLDVCDFINYAVEDDGITVIATVIEGLSDGPRFREVAQRAAAKGKPIVALKIGRSEYGRQSAMSHTASIAGDDAVVDAVFDELNVVRVDDVDELAETAALLARVLDHTMSNPSIPVDQTCVVSFSGGTAALVADLAGVRGLTLAALAPSTLEALQGVAPEFGFVGNPVDLTTDALTDPTLNGAILNAVTADPNVGSVLFAMPADYGEMSVSATRDAISICSAARRLLVPIWPSPTHGEGFALLEKAGSIPFGGANAAVKALSRIAQWTRNRVDQADGVTNSPAWPYAGQGPVTAAVDHEPDGRSVVSWEDARNLLMGYGLTFPREAVVADARAAVQAAESIGFPVALKIMAPGVTHKSDVGGVILGLTTGEEVVEAVTTAKAGSMSAGRDASRFVVQQMISGGVELLLGAHRDPAFGLTVTVGRGGIYAEYENDVAHMTLPLSPDIVRRRIAGLRFSAQLGSARGRSPVDLEAVVAAVLGFGRLLEDHDDTISELEINPLMAVRADSGGGAYVVDVVMIEEPSRLGEVDARQLPPQPR